MTPTHADIRWISGNPAHRLHRPARALVVPALFVLIAALIAVWL